MLMHMCCNNLETRSMSYYRDLYIVIVSEKTFCKPVPQFLTMSGQIVRTNDSKCIIITWDKVKNVITSGRKWIEVGRGSSYIDWGVDINVRR